MTASSRALLLAVALLPDVAGAHPLGNITTNRWTAVEVRPGSIRLTYAVDFAELPAFRERERLDADDDGTVDAAERQAYVTTLGAEIARGLSLRLDGRQLALTPIEPRLEETPGVAGLPTLRLDVAFDAPLAAAHGRVELRDDTFAGRPGWQEVVARAADGIRLTGASVPAVDRSQALRAYPADMLAAPLRVAEAQFQFEPGAPAPAPDVVPAPAATRRSGDRLADLLADPAPLSATTIVLALLVAAVLGAGHALTPGHGKTIVGAYLVGARGTARHAILLGLIVTATHTLGVYALGLTTWAASSWIVPERLFPWISVASGLLVVAVGASLARARLLGIAHAHDGHPHHHHHGHGDGDHHHHHHHLPADGGPLGVRGLVALGVSGGLLPCPSALVVMLAAIAVGRTAFGLLLIVAFSVGLASVLTGVGLALVYARGLFERLPLDGRVARYVPVASALVVSLAGLALVVQALAQLGA